MLTQQQQAFLDVTGLDYKQSGSEIVTPCPFCGEQRYKFYFNSNGLFHCWICETSGGSIYSFVSQYLKCSNEEAKKYLKEYSFEFDNTSRVIENLKSKSLLDVLTEQIAPGIYANETMPELPSNTKSLIENFNNPEAFPYFMYLKKRGITYAQLFKYDIRYCVSGRCLLPSGGTLWINHSIIFVSYDKQGKEIYWNTRSIDKEPFIKSFNAASANNQYSRTNVVFNENNIFNYKPVVWCEGVFNAITVDSNKRTGIATFGKKITDEQIERVISICPNSIHYIFLDTDAQQEAMLLARKLLSKSVSSNNIYIVNNPYQGQDANDLGRLESNKLIESSTKFVSQDTISDIIKL